MDVPQEQNKSPHKGLFKKLAEEGVEFVMLA